jgi:hypothetical protein
MTVKISNGFSEEDVNEVVIQVGYGTRKKMRQVLFSNFFRTLIKGKRNPESLISGRIGC